MIWVECSLSKNYNKFTVGFETDLEPGKDLVEETKRYQALARKLVKEQIALEVLK